MATKATLTVRERNSETIVATLSSDDPTFTMVGKTFEFFLKRRKTDPDEDAVLALTSDPANGIVVTDVPLKKLTISIPKDVIEGSSAFSYRLDVLEGGTKLNTAAHGTMVVEDL